MNSSFIAKKKKLAFICVKVEMPVRHPSGGVKSAV